MGACQLTSDHQWVPLALREGEWGTWWVTTIVCVRCGKKKDTDEWIEEE